MDSYSLGSCNYPFLHSGSNLWCQAVVTHGIDLGQTNDFTTHAVCETTDGITELRFIDRYNKQSYNDMMKRSAKIIHAKFGDVWGDATGAASPAAFEILQGIIDPYPVNLTMVKITSGMNIGVSEGYLTVPRGLLIDGLRIGIQNQTVKFPKVIAVEDSQVNMIPILYQELLEFQSEISTAGNVVFKHRQGHHDDLLFAVCLAVFGASQGGNQPCGYVRRYK